MLRSFRSAWIAPIAAMMLLACGGTGDTSGQMEEGDAQGEMQGDQMGGDEMGGMEHDTAGMMGDTTAAGEGM